MISTIKVDQCAPKFGDRFFFDANVWLLLFCPVGDWNAGKQRKYGDFLKLVQAARSGVFINSLVLSEFCNRAFRIDYDMYLDQFPNLDYKKDYLPSEYYQETAKSVIAAVQQILKIAERISDDFNAIDLERIYSSLLEIDFNDSYYAELVERKNWTLVTDDGDYIRSSQKITIVSANSKY